MIPLKLAFSAFYSMTLPILKFKIRNVKVSLDCSERRL
jgi:hypothetical protein